MENQSPKFQRHTEHGPRVAGLEEISTRSTNVECTYIENRCETAARREGFDHYVVHHL